MKQYVSGRGFPPPTFAGFLTPSPEFVLGKERVRRGTGK